MNIKTKHKLEVVKLMNKYGLMDLRKRPFMSGCDATPEIPFETLKQFQEEYCQMMGKQFYETLSQTLPYHKAKEAAKHMPIAKFYNTPEDYQILDSIFNIPMDNKRIEEIGNMSSDTLVKLTEKGLRCTKCSPRDKPEHEVIEALNGLITAEYTLGRRVTLREWQKHLKMVYDGSCKELGVVEVDAIITYEIRSSATALLLGLVEELSLILA